MQVDRIGDVEGAGRRGVLLGADRGAGVEVDDAVVEQPEVMVGEAHADLPLERVGDVDVGRLHPARRAVGTRGQVDVQPVLVLVEREQRAREEVLGLLRERRHRLRRRRRAQPKTAMSSPFVAAARNGTRPRSAETFAPVVELRRGGGGRRGGAAVAAVRCHSRPRGRRRRSRRPTTHEHHDADGCPQALAAPSALLGS